MLCDSHGALRYRLEITTHSNSDRSVSRNITLNYDSCNYLTDYNSILTIWAWRGQLWMKRDYKLMLI
jgi:hypothetical protein